jgi:hypothetical protein
MSGLIKPEMEINNMANINLDMFKDALEVVKGHIDKQEKLLNEVCEVIKSMFCNNIKSTEINSVPEVVTQDNGKVCVSAKTSLILTLKDDKQIHEEFKDSINTDLVINQLSSRIINLMTGKPERVMLSPINLDDLVSDKFINMADVTKPMYQKFCNKI